MKIRTRLVNAAVLLAIAVPLAIAAPKDGVTVGWFLKEIATSRGLAVSSEAEAGNALQGAGVKVPQLDPTKSLTEGDVVQIGQALGITTATQDPQSPMSRSRAQSFLSTFSSEIGTGRDGSVSSPTEHDNSSGNSSKGKGKKKGHTKSPTEPL